MSSRFRRVLRPCPRRLAPGCTIRAQVRPTPMQEIPSSSLPSFHPGLVPGCGFLLSSTKPDPETRPVSRLRCDRFPRRQTQFFARREVAVEAEAQPDRDLDRGDRAFLDLERIEQQQVAAMFCQTI